MEPINYFQCLCALIEELNKLCAHRREVGRLNVSIDFNTSEYKGGTEIEFKYTVKLLDKEADHSQGWIYKEPLEFNFFILRLDDAKGDSIYKEAFKMLTRLCVFGKSSSPEERTLPIAIFAPRDILNMKESYFIENYLDRTIELKENNK